MKKCIDIALNCGFTSAGELDCSTIEVRTEVRDMCATNTCQQYNKNWACPPACGSLEECESKIKNYKKGIIVQTTTELEDSMDFEGIQELGEKHSENLKKTIEELSKMYPNMLTLGTGFCNICSKCTYPDEYCRFPEKRISSMEAFGIVVNDVCKANNLPYNYGKNTMTYIGCFLLE